jgi:hypothetical protein
MPRFDRAKRAAGTGLGPVLLLAAALCLLLAASATAAAPNWLEPADLSKPGRDASNPRVETDNAGNTVAIWERQSTGGPTFNLQMSTRAPGGAFAVPIDFLQNSTDPQLVVSPSGEMVAAWKHFENTPDPKDAGYLIQISTRAPGGEFSPPVTVYKAPQGVIPQELRVAVGAAGHIAVTWSRIDPTANFPNLTCGINPMTGKPVKCSNPPFVEGSVRPPGGVFAEAKRISTPRGEGPPGETEKEKEEREIFESKLNASGAHAVVDGAGNVTVIWGAFNGVDNVVQASTGGPNGVFGAPFQVSESGEDAGSAEIGVDAAGNAIASWQRNEGSDQIVQAAIKPPGGAFAPLGNLSAAGGSAEQPVLDVAPNGTAIVVWRLSGLTESFLQASTRPPGGAFSPPSSLSSGKDNPLFHRVALSEEGDVVVAWSGDNGTNEIARAAVRPAGSAAFGPPAAISQSSAGLFHPLPSIDADGNATVVWVRDNGSHDIVQWAGYDAEPPQLRDVSVPATAKVAETLQFSASTFDAWPVGAPSFAFGDGTVAEGGSVSHAYGAPGRYDVTVTAKDAVGRTATSTASILVKARNSFTIGKLKRNRKRGTATLAVTVLEPGTLVASGKGIKKSTVRGSKGGTLKVPLKAAGKGLKRLRSKGKLKAKLKISFSPVGGDTNTRPYKLTLKKNLR